MKFKYHSRFIALVVIVSMLLSCMIMPVAVTAATESFDSAIKTMASDDSLTDNETLFSDEKAVLRSDDPIIKDSAILHYVDSAQFDNARHTVRLSELEDLNTYVFQNADGTRTVYLLDENVKYVNSEGKTVEKNLSLVANKQGYEITQSNIGLTMSNNPRDGIHLDYLDHTVTITPVTQNTDTIAVKKDNSIVYTDIFGSNVSLKYTPLLSGVKEDIILSSYIPNASYSFTLDTDGLYVCEKDHKYFLAESADGKPLLYLGDVITYDAIGKPSEGTMTVKTILAGSEYTVTVAADEAFLSDPTTVYPVTIDPSITISDNNNGSNAIEDSPIYAGFSNRNFGAYLFNPVGTPDSTFGIGRTVVRLSGLINSSIYKDLDSSQITNVTFYATEGSGAATQYINLYPLTGNTTWTESTVTWNNIGSYTTAVNYGASMKGGQCAAFDITGLVRAWKNKTYSADAGFIMVSQNEAVNKSFCSSEYSTTSYRPYVVITYSPDISLNYTSASIVEGGTKTLVATTKPSGQSVTWSTSNSSVATVSSSGVVTAKKAGTATITAKTVDADGVSRLASCTVYVYITDGVYYIKNLNSNYYLHVKSGGIDNFSDVYQYSKYADSTDQNYRIRQMWKTYYLGNGRYSVRPMSKLDMGLDVTNGNVDIYKIGTSDTLSGVPSYGEWTIGWSSNGYVFKNDGSDSLTMQIKDASKSSGATVVASTYSTALNCRWGLTKISSPPSGVYLYDTLKKSIVNTATRSVDVGAFKSFSEQQFVTVAYSGNDISQSFSWYTSDTSIAKVDSNGNITGVATGKATINGYVYRNGSYYGVSYTICVGFPSLFNTLINSNILVADKLDLTDDGFFLTTTPLSTILVNKGIPYIPINSGGADTWNVNYYFDDWYLFGVKSGATVSYGLFKMREQESDIYDGNNPGVTISFIGLDATMLTNCFNNNSTANGYALFQSLTKVTGPGSYEDNDEITSYFASTSSDGSYLIAEKYISFIINRVSGNAISAPDSLISIFHEIDEIDELLSDVSISNNAIRANLSNKKADLQRVPNALKAINNAAGRTIFDFSNYTITVQNKNNLTKYEKQAILSCFTYDVTFNSFAAEVEFHADAINSWQSDIPWLGDKWYEAAIRADMAVGEEYESGYYDEYYDLNSSIVRAQADAHGEY